MALLEREQIAELDPQRESAANYVARPLSYAPDAAELEEFTATRRPLYRKVASKIAAVSSFKAHSKVDPLGFKVPDETDPSLARLREIKAELLSRTPDFLPAVIFVGAGPVGLLAAIQAKLQAKKEGRDLQILMLEKYESYNRKHLLKLEKSSLNGCHPGPNNEFAAIIEELKKSKKILTTDLEKKLYDFAIAEGIQIKKGVKVERVRNLRYVFPSVKVVVGADGAHSRVQSEIFDDERQYHKNLQYMAQAKYTVVGETNVLNVLKEGYRTQKLVDAFVSEVVGKPRVVMVNDTPQTQTDVTVNFFIDRKTYEALKDQATFQERNRTVGDVLAAPESRSYFGLKELHELAEADNASDPAKQKNYKILCKKIDTWLSVRSKFAGENPDSRTNPKITVTPLNAYCSKKFVKQENDVDYIGVGDSVLGIPFFRSLNAGFKGAILLGKCLSELPDELVFSSLKGADRFSKYSAYMAALAAKEISSANFKSLFIWVAAIFIRISGNVPWQINRWTDRDVALFANTPGTVPVSRVGLVEGRNLDSPPTFVPAKNNPQIELTSAHAMGTFVPQSTLNFRSR